jgi:hypothetical protein
VTVRLLDETSIVSVELLPFVSLTATEHAPVSAPESTLNATEPPALEGVCDEVVPPPVNCATNAFAPGD